MTAEVKLTILGCGSSGGVPRIGNYWGACDPSEPRNRRRRCSVLVQLSDGQGGPSTDVLVDTAPEIRDQMNDCNLGRLDGVIFTHSHADQCHGIDDLRMVAINMRKRVPIYADTPTLATLKSRFDYCFVTPKGSSYPPIIDGHLIEPLKEFSIEGPGGSLAILPFAQEHGDIVSLGFRFGGRSGPVAYTSDAVGLPAPSFSALDGLECWIVDALRYTEHPSHAHVKMSLGWIEKVKAKRGILTNLHVDLDYKTLKAELPRHIEPAYDGLTLTFILK